MFVLGLVLLLAGIVLAAWVERTVGLILLIVGAAFLIIALAAPRAAISAAALLPHL
jgi:hypothetical protein